jgi:succinate dehydrogenase hydrophobic anchor subunit
MLPNYISVACITLCLAIIYTPWLTWQKCILGSILSTISTFSFANGLLCWLVFLPAFIMVHSFPNTREKRLAILASLTVFISNIVLYFSNYSKPGGHPSFLLVLSKPLQAIQYFLVLLGVSLGFSDRLASLAVGLVLVLLTIFVLFYTLSHWKDSNFRYQVTGWLLLGIYSLMTSIITTAGRLGFGIEQALYTSRYTTHSIYLPIALIHLLAIIAVGGKTNWSSSRQKVTTIILISLTFVFLLFHTLSYITGYEQMINYGQDRLRNKACLQWINQVQDQECLTKNVNPELNFLVTTANQLNEFNLIQPPLITSKRLQDMEGKNVPSDRVFGYFEALEKTPDNQWLARGWAVLPQYNSVAHAVILSYKQADGSDIAFAIAGQRDKRNDVSQALKNTIYKRAGWHKILTSEQIPAEAKEISAWAFDANRREVFKLQTQPNVRLER